MHQHNFSLTELDDMLPWEREIYISLVQEHVEKENKRMREQQNG
jgi:hypothetical protein|tara:strand:+ start:398 stop:529 length:132 start_codon:yes stop_codon:yes gene_type:complete